MGQALYGQVLLQLLRGHAVQGGHLGVFLLQLRVGKPDVFQSGDLRHGQLKLHRGPGAALRLPAQILPGNARHLQIGVHGGPLALKLLLHVLQEAVQLALDHPLRNVHLHPGNDLLHQGVGVGVGGLLLLCAHRLLHDAPAQGGGVGIALGLGEFVVHVGLHPARYLVDLDVEHRVLARQLRGILGGEGDGNVPLAAHGQPGHLLLKPGDEVAAAQQQGILLRLAALKGYAVHEALKVQHHLVAHGGLLRVLLGEMILQVFPDGGGNIVVR